MRPAALALLAGLGLATTGSVAAAQRERLWLNQLYPYAYYSSVDGFWIAGHVGWYSPVGFAPRPEPNLAAINVDASVSTEGSRWLVVDAQAPAYWTGWRLGIVLSAIRENRLGYFGQGNATTYEADSVTDARPHLYQVSRVRQSLRVTVQRRIVGPLRVLVGAHVERSDFRALPGDNAYKRDVASGAVDTTRLPTSDATLRAGLVLDQRDHEIDPHRGFLVEALYATGRDYTRSTASARVYVHPLERLVLAGRLAGERMTGAPPLAAQFSMEASDRPFVAVGGYRSLRGFYDGRFVGPGKLLAGVEARYGLLWAPTLFELNLVAFYDAGRVFGPGEVVRLTGDGLHSAGGVEIGVRFLPNGLIVAGVGFGSEGYQILFGSTWSY